MIHHYNWIYMGLNAATEGRERRRSIFLPVWMPFPLSERFCVPIASIKLPKPNKASRIAWGVGRDTADLNEEGRAFLKVMLF